MSSKYDTYWQSKLDDIAQLLKEAYQYGSSSKLDISDIQNYGARKSWYGIVEVFEESLRKGEMAHARSLGGIIFHNKLLGPYGRSGFRIVISSNLKLRVDRLDVRDREIFVPTPYAKINTSILGTKYEYISNRKYLFVEIIKNIPWEVWEYVIRNEPEWHYMESFLSKFGYGPFAVLMASAGLNDYQLKGKAEEDYWPRIHRLLEVSSTPKSPRDLYNLFEPFYKTERLHTVKIQRLRRFLNSLLANKLWNSSPKKVSGEFLIIWKELTKIMAQKPEDKTICFAMKCLAISLLMLKEYKFDFNTIPIPVDLRVKRFTEIAKLSTSDKNKEIRAIWHEILSLLKQTHLNITMIHLDSLVWQISSLQEDKLQRYFENLGIQRVGKSLSSFLQRSLIHRKPKPIVTKELKDIGKSLTSTKLRGKKVLIIFPCSAKKQKNDTYETFTKDEERKVIDYIVNTKDYLLNGRKGMESYIDKNSGLIAALDRYNGFLYSVDNFRESLREIYFRKDIHILIMSGAYGILTPSEKIHYYRKLMNAKYWKKHCLTKIIEEYIDRNKITNIYGFFARTSAYIKIMKSISWLKLKENTSLIVAITYYINFQSKGGALRIVPETLGKLIVSFIKYNFNHNNFYTIPFNGQDVGVIDHFADIKKEKSPCQMDISICV